jgi:hypothetical protein
VTRLEDVAIQLHERLGAVRERDFRLLFTGTMITAIGDRLAGVALPPGMALVGPLSDAIGITETLWIAVVVMWTSWAAILALPSVWAIRAEREVPAASAA